MELFIVTQQRLIDLTNPQWHCIIVFGRAESHIVVIIFERWRRRRWYREANCLRETSLFPVRSDDASLLLQSWVLGLRETPTALKIFANMNKKALYVYSKKKCNKFVLTTNFHIMASEIASKKDSKAPDRLTWQEDTPLRQKSFQRRRHHAEA